MRALISGWWRSCSMSWISWSLSWFWTVFLSLIPTVFSDVAKFVHFILQKSSLFSHPLSITPTTAARLLQLGGTGGVLLNLGQFIEAFREAFEQFFVKWVCGGGEGIKRPLSMFSGDDQFGPPKIGEMPRGR